MPCQLYYPASKSAYLTLNSVFFCFFLLCSVSHSSSNALRYIIYMFSSKKNGRSSEFCFSVLQRNSAGSGIISLMMMIFFCQTRVLMRLAFVFVKRNESHLRARSNKNSTNCGWCDHESRLWNEDQRRQWVRIREYTHELAHIPGRLEVGLNEFSVSLSFHVA